MGSIRRGHDLLVLAGAAWLVSGSASAHEINAPPVDVRGHYDTAVGTSDAASAGSITAKRIETRPVLRPGEILEFVPGLIVTQHSGDGKANQYFVRGFNLDHGTDFAVSVAGIPVNMPTHAHGQGYADLSFLIPELVSGINYRKGPYFADNGDFASAGSVSLRYADSLPTNTATLTLGNFDYKRALLTGSPDVGNGHLVYGLEAVGNDGPWDSPAGYRKFNGVLKLVQGNQTNGFNVTLMGYDGKWDSTDQIPQRAVDRGEISRFGLIDPTDGGRSSRYSLSGSRYADFKGGRYEIDAYAMSYSLNLFSNFTYLLDNPAQGDQFEQSDRRTVYGLHPRVTFVNKVGSFDMLNRIGFQTRYDDIDQVALFNTAGQTRLSTTRDDKVRQASMGLYAENATQWLSWFRSVAGVRADFYQFDVNSSLAANSGKLNDHIISPKLNLVFGPWSKTEYFANFGRGFHSNDARGTTIRVDPKTGLPVDAVTPLVRSEGAEIGVRTEIIPNLQSSLALWQLKLDSELLFVGDAGSTVASRPSKRTGIEWTNHYVLPAGLLVDLQLSWSRARFTESDPAGDHIPGSIQRVASLGITWNPGDKWFVAIQQRYLGPRPLIEDDSVRSRSTNLTNLRVGYRVDKTWQVRLDIFNLFNRKASDIDYYYASCIRSDTVGANATAACQGPAGTRTGVNDVQFHPVESIGGRVSVTASF